MNPQDGKSTHFSNPVYDLESGAGKLNGAASPFANNVEPMTTIESYVTRPGSAVIGRLGYCRIVIILHI